jgi:5-methylcytosine-specific restriction endonuclease McrA
MESLPAIPSLTSKLLMPIDYTTYHPRWKKISIFIRQYRAKNKCEWCGALNHEPHPVTGSRVVLTVAHIDHDKNNNSFFNLAALCQRCHLNHDKHEHIINRLLGRGWRDRQFNLFNN